MPITQTRMIALIDAARDYQQAWERAQEAFQLLNSAVNDGITTHQQAWYQVENLLTSSLRLVSPITTTKTLEREITHFRLMKKRNENSAKWQRKARAEHGADPQDTQATDRPAKPKPAPATITPPPQTDENEIPLNYIPKELSPERRAAIDLEMAQARAIAELEGEMGLFDEEDIAPSVEVSLKETVEKLPNLPAGEGKSG